MTKNLATWILVLEPKRENFSALLRKVLLTLLSKKRVFIITRNLHCGNYEQFIEVGRANVKRDIRVCFFLFFFVLRNTIAVALVLDGPISSKRITYYLLLYYEIHNYHVLSRNASLFARTVFRNVLFITTRATF